MLNRTIFTQSGFTVVELLIVCSIIALLGISTYTGYVSYNNSQIFSNAALNVKVLFTLAQSRSESQVKPIINGVNVCLGKQLGGYEVRICGNGATCLAGDNYELYVDCGTSSFLVSAGTLPQGITFTNQPATPFIFPAVTGAVTSGTFNINQGATKKTFTVNGAGLVTLQ